MKIFSIIIFFLCTVFIIAQNNDIKLKKIEAENVELKMSGDKKTTDLKVFKRDKEEKKDKKATKDDFIKQKEIEKLELVEKQIANTEDLLEDMDDESEEKAGFMFKLAEMYRKKAKGLWLKGMSFDDIDPKDKAEAEKLKKDKEEHLKLSMENTQKAVDIYGKIYETFPNFEEADKVLFSKAQTLDEMKQTTLAIKDYKKLAKDFPESRYIPDTYLALGEFYFTNDDMETAKKAYSRVVQYKDSELYNYATYKLGWCEFNMAESKAAFQIFVEILKGGDPNEKFIEQVKLDLVFIYSQFAAPNTAKDVFLKLFGDVDYLDYLDKLAYTYKDKQGKLEEALYIFKQLLSLESDELKLLRYYIAIVDTSNTTNKIRNVIESVVIASQFLQKIGEQYSGDKEFKKLQTDLEGLIKELATNYHKQAVETRNDLDLKIAVKFYKEYQKLFREFEDFYQMLFQYAQLLDEQLGEQENAIDVYIDIITSPKGKKTNNFVEDAVNNALAIYGDLIRQEQAKKNTAQANCHKQKEIKPQPLTRRQDQFVKLVEIFIQHNPQSKEIPAARYNSAKVYYEVCDFDKALPLFEEILKNNVGSETYELAASSTLDILNLRKEYTLMYKWITKFAENRSSFSKQFLAQIDENIEALAFMSPKELEEKKNFYDSGKAYYEFYKKYPKSKRAFYSLYNSAIMYESGNFIKESIQVREEIINNPSFANEKEVRDVLFFLAQNYQGVARFKDAAQYYEKFFIKYPKDKDAVLTLTTAIDFYEAIEEVETLKRANELIDLYIQAKKINQKEQATWNFRKGENIEKMNDYKESLTFWGNFERGYSNFLSPDKQIEVQFKIGKAYEALGNSKSAKAKYKDGYEFYDKLNSKYKNSLSDDVRKLLAGYKFNELEETYNKFKAVKLELPEAKMAQNLKFKVGLKQQLTKNYNESAKEFKNAYWSIAFYFKIASMTYDFAKDIAESPIPPKLTDEQKEMYKQELSEAYVIPLEEEAFKAFFKCYEIAMKNEIFNEWVTKSIEMMLKIDPSAFKANFDEIYTTVDFNDILFEKKEPIISVENEKKDNTEKKDEKTTNEGNK